MARLPVHVFAADPLTGNALASVSCTVKNRATGASASLWDAESGGSSVSNPLTTNSNGRAFAWTDSAQLQIDYSGGGITAYSEYRSAPIDFVSALPSSPYDTQEIYYQSAAMATAGVVWHFRYRLAGHATYKWEYLGGPPMHLHESGSTALAAVAGWQDPTPTMPMTIPLNGEYHFGFGASPKPSATGQYVGVGVHTDAGVQVTTPTYFNNAGLGGGAMDTEVWRQQTVSGIVAGVHKLRTFNNSTTAGTIQRRSWTFIPVRVG